MGFAVGGSALLKCSFGSAPSALNVLPVNRCVSALPLANSTDNKPFVNILPFGMCALTQAPCIPLTSAPWMPGSQRVLIGNMPALDHNCKLLCNAGGLIEIVNAGQTTVSVN